MSDWRIIRVDWTRHCGDDWIREKQIKECGIYYLVDVNLHVHICSLTPSLEAWPMNAYATFTSDEARETDEGEVELELMASEEPVSYFGTEIGRLPSRPASDYVQLPSIDEGESAENYRARVADEVREYLAGNPAGF